MRFSGAFADVPSWYHPLVAFTRHPQVLLGDPGEELRASRRQVAARNLMVISVLEQLLARLASDGVRPLLLKGTCLAETAYPPGVRTLGDIDILVKNTDLTRAQGTLTRLGYSLRKDGVPVWVRCQFAGKLEYYVHDPVPIAIDLHVALGPYPYLGRFPVDRMWDRARPHPLGLAPCYEHVLLHACLHMLHHLHDNPLPSLCDIALLVRQYYHLISWRDFLDDVSACKLQLPVAYALSAVHTLCPDLELPARVQVRTEGSSRSERRLFTRYTLASSGYSRYLLQFSSHPSFGSRLRVLPHLLFPTGRCLGEIHPGVENLTPARAYMLHYRSLAQALWSLAVALTGSSGRDRKTAPVGELE